MKIKVLTRQYLEQYSPAELAVFKKYGGQIKETTIGHTQHKINYMDCPTIQVNEAELLSFIKEFGSAKIEFKDDVCVVSV